MWNYLRALYECVHSLLAFHPCRNAYPINAVPLQKVAAAWSRSNLPPPELDTMFRCMESIYKANRSLLAVRETGAISNDMTISSMPLRNSRRSGQIPRVSVTYSCDGSVRSILC